MQITCLRQKMTHTLINVVRREEALLSISQLTHPPVIIVLEQHCDAVATCQRQFVRSLCLVVIQCNHLQQDCTASETTAIVTVNIYLLYLKGGPGK